jgi:hypothetical protein
MIQDQSHALRVLDQQTFRNLSDCAKKFLDQDVKALSIVEQLDGEHQNDDIQSLALRLMENALPLENGNTLPTLNSHVPHFRQVDHFAGSH